MITRDHNEIVFECESCSETLETGEEEWNDAYRKFNHEGWKAVKGKGGWGHYCYKCYQSL